MPSKSEIIRNLLEQHYNEAAAGLIDKAPSRLTRGEGTEKPYFIMKIDLVGSTLLLSGRHKATYLKFAHTFLSTIDRITQQFGAEAQQVEYAGDSVMAYFPASATAENVIEAACCSRDAVQQMKGLDNTLRSFELKCKIVLHYADLIVANIGPRANSNLIAIGYPLHQVAKLEKEIGAGVGRATEKFYHQVARENKKFLQPIYQEKQVLVPIPAPMPSIPIPSLPPFGGYSRQNMLADILLNRNIPIPPHQAPQHIIEKTVIGYNLIWPLLFHALKLNT